MPIEKYAKLLPRVEQTTSQEPTSQPHPRVQFNEAVETPGWLVVAWPRKQIFQSSPKKTTTKPKPILKPSKYVVESDSIAARVKAKQAAPQAQGDNLSIAERVAAQRQGQKPPQIESVHAVLNQETGQLLEYRQLLKHPRFKEVWN